MPTINVHKELLNTQQWIGKMVNDYEAIVDKSIPAQHTALLQHHTCSVWLTKVLVKLHQMNGDREYLQLEKQLSKFVDTLVNNALLHPSLYVIALIYFSKFLEKTKKKLNLIYFETYFVVAVILAFKMYDDFQDLPYSQLVRHDCQKQILENHYIKIETSILKTLEYSMVVNYKEFDEFIQECSKDNSLDVVFEVMSIWNTYVVCK